MSSPFDGPLPDQLRDLVREVGTVASAHLIGVPKGTISRWVNGKMTPSPLAMQAIARGIENHQARARQRPPTGPAASR